MVAATPQRRIDIRDYLSDDVKRAILEKTKYLYINKLPKDREDILKYQLQWGSLFKNDVLEKVARPWIGKKIKDYMGVEELSVVQLIIKLLNARPEPNALKDKLKEFLDEKAEEFVVKLWQTLIFENMKIDEGLYDN